MNEAPIIILLIESDIPFFQYIEKNLSEMEYVSSDYILKTADSLRQSFLQFNPCDCDIALLDLELNDSSGLKTLEKFRKKFPDLPVIVITDHRKKEIGIEAIKKGASAFLTKNEITPGNLYKNIFYSLERNSIQLQLKNEKQLLRDYLELSEVIIVELDKEQRIRKINKAGCRMMGLYEKELLGLNWFDTFSQFNKRENLKRNFDDVLHGRSNKTAFENIMVVGDQRLIISWKTRVIKDKSGKPVGVLGSGTDVTAIKASKIRLRKINKQYRINEKLKNEFVINISHELRTPLTIFRNIISNALAGINGKISSKLAVQLRHANDAIERLALIITDFLDISRIEAGKVKLNYQKFEIQKLINETVEHLNPVIKSNYMDVELSMPEIPLEISADRNMIIQIMSKLIENSAKFVPDVGGKVAIRVIDKQDKIEINVEDNGNGIQGDNINLIFNRFIQIERCVGEGNHGTGLGLSITKELVELHGGKIWVENVPDGGANFRIELPKTKLNSADQQDDETLEITETIESLSEQVENIAGICTNTNNSENSDKQQENASKIPLDWQLAIKYCGDEDVILKIAESVLQETPKYVESLIDATRDHNRADTVYYAHKLRGSIITLGVQELAEIAEQAENAAGEEDFETVEKLIPEIKGRFSHLESFLKLPNWTEIAKKTKKSKPLKNPRKPLLCEKYRDYAHKKSRS